MAKNWLSVNIGKARVAVTYSGRPGREGRDRYLWRVTLPDGKRHQDDDFQSGCQGGSLREGLESLLGFLSAAGESVGHERRTGRAGENADIFPRPVSEWADQHQDEIDVLLMEMEERAARRRR